jgi:hypothetical protein
LGLAATIKATGAPRALQGFAQRSIYWKRRRNFDGPERAVHVRIAEHAGHIYLDLGDEQWRAVDIGPDGWRLTACPPVRFRRPAGMLPLPVPQQGGSVEPLNSFLNLVSRDDFVLICLAVGSTETEWPLFGFGDFGRAGLGQGSVQNLSHFRFWLSGARPWLTR